MTNITEGNNLGDLLKYEVSNLYSRDQIIVAKGQNIKLGGVVAKKTDDGFIRVLSPSGLCCIATEKIWWLLTKFIIK